MLPSESNSTRIERLIRQAARQRFGQGKASPIYEHGHWWITLGNNLEDTDLIYDVVDVKPPHDIGGTGFNFERV